MPKQPAKTTRQSAKFREQQLRRRMASQARAGETMEYDEVEESITPSNGSTTTVFAPASAAASTVAAPRVAPRPTITPRPTVPSSSSTLTGVRATRGRLAAQVQAMNLEEEMSYVRGDITRMLVLAAAGIIILVILAFFL